MLPIRIIAAMAWLGLFGRGVAADGAILIDGCGLIVGRLCAEDGPDGLAAWLTAPDAASR